MATQDPTQNYSWDLPASGDTGWGTTLNSIIGDDSTGIDTVVKAVSDVADAALPKAGGTMTGTLNLLTAADTLNALGSVSGSTDIDFDSGNAVSATIGGATTFTFSNVPSGTLLTGLILVLTNPGSSAITWPASVEWPGGAAPSLTASGVDIIAGCTIDSGTTWRLWRVGADFS